VTIANLLALPVRQEQHRIVEAVKRWFGEHTSWLLIFDNADNLTMVHSYLPLGSKGHVLLTTRAHATGRIAKRIEVQKMEPDEGALFLLHRATILDADAPLDDATRSDLNTAKEIVQAMDGLPLALDQAGAYIEETNCGLQGYWRIYQTQGAKLLKERGGLVTDHPDPVATTWSLSFQNVEQTNPAAAELLRFCAFLAPDAIPEALFSESAVDLGPKLELVASDPSMLNAAIRELLKYSLVQRDPETKTISIHRLVQEVLKDQMEEEVQREWAARAVHAVNRAFPAVEFENWTSCREYLPHALICAELIEQHHFATSSAAELLYRMGCYLEVLAQYTLAEALLQRAMRNSEQALGAEHPETAKTLHALAYFYMERRKYAEVEALFQRALHIREQALGPEHPETAKTLHALSDFYHLQDKYTEAEPLLQRALRISEQALGPEHPETAATLVGLGWLYQDQGKYVEAEPLYQRALHIREQVLGPDHPATAASLHVLADFYHLQDKYTEAEPLYQGALRISEQALGPEHPETAVRLVGLGWLSQDQGKYAESEAFFQRALHIREQVLGPEDLYTADTLYLLAKLYYNQRRYAEAESLYRRTLRIREQALGAEHPDTAQALDGLAQLYRDQDRYAEAEPLEARIRALRAKSASS
jgi:tetratricopeptide (TPR) repeat protein